MSPHEQSEFTAAFTSMVAALGAEKKLRESPGIGGAYWDTLKSFDLGTVRAGFRYAASHYNGMHALPRPAQVREYCEQAQRELRKTQGEAPTPACDTCDATGWETRACPGVNGSWAWNDGCAVHALPPDMVAPQPCRRDGRHEPHSYAVRCHCRQIYPEAL